MIRGVGILAGLCVAASAVGVMAQRVVPFTVAAVQYGGDGTLLVPVARFTGTSWVHTWPAPADMSAPVPPLDAIPTPWLGRPVPRAWTAWSASGRRTAVRVVGTARGGACEGPVALKIDRVLPVRGIAAADADVATIAIDGPQAVEGFAPLTVASPDWASIEALAAVEFSRLERVVVDEFRDQGELKKAMLEDAIRPGRRPRMDAAFGPAGEARPRVVWFEATKRTAAIAAYGISVSGWAFRTGDGRWTTFDPVATVLAADSGPVPGRVPLARFQVEGRIYWIVQAIGYEGASVLLFEVGSADVEQLLDVSLGGC